MVAGTGNKKLLVHVSNISFSQIIKRLQQLSLCCVELVELLPQGGGGGGTLIFSHIRRLGPLFFGSKF